MDETNPLDALDEAPGANPAASETPPAAAAAPPDSQLQSTPVDSGNPLDELDEEHPAVETHKALNEALGQTTGDQLPEVTIQADRQKPASWGDVGGAILPTIGANIETKLAGVEEWKGSTDYNSARKKLWQSMVLPEAVRRAQEQNIPLTEDNEVVSLSQHLGIRPDQFTRDWPTYVNQGDKERQEFQAKQRQRIQDSEPAMTEGGERRRMAAQVSQGVAPNTEASPLKGLAFETATMAPDLLVGVGGTMATGGVGGVALMAADIAPGEYAQARNMGLDDRKASTYAMLSTVASSVPEVPVLRVVSGSAAGRKILQTAVGEKLASHVAGKVAGTSITQGVTQSFVQALQQGIDSGLLDEKDSLSDALGKIAHAGLVGTVTGAPLGLVHHALTREPKPTTLKDQTPAGQGEQTPAGQGPQRPRREEGESTADYLERVRQAHNASLPPLAPAPHIELTGEGASQFAPVPRGTEPSTENAEPPASSDTHAALLALEAKDPTPPQLEMLEKAGLATRNDVGIPRFLPAGRRELNRLNQAKPEAATVAPSAQGEPEQPPPHTDEEVPPIRPEGTGQNEAHAEWAGLSNEKAAAAPLSKEEEKASTTPFTSSVPTKTPELPQKTPVGTELGVNRFTDDQDLRAALSAMKNETGWAETGGRVIRNEETGAVTGRTKWVPNAEWWPGRPKGLTETQVHAAVDKALAGQKLSKRESSMVEYMRDVHDARQATEAYLPQNTDTPADYEHKDQLHVPTDDAYEAGMVARLADLDPDTFESLAKEHEDSEPADFLKAVKAALDEHDRQTTGSYRPEGAGSVAEETKKTVGGDLFGQDLSRQQALHNETLRRDAERSGSGKDISPDTGRPGDLFSTNANRQTDLVDAVKARREEGVINKVVEGDGRERAEGAEGFRLKDIVRLNVPNAPKDRQTGQPIHHGERARIRSIFRFRAGDPWIFGVSHEFGGMQALSAHELQLLSRKPQQEGLFADQLKEAREATNTTPTDAMKEAGNYAKGRVSFGGMEVAIENPAGSVRKGISSKGENWERTMKADYGYIKGTQGKDGDAVDVFLTGKPDTGRVFVINQMNPQTGGFDEHKAILGADDRREATKTYRDHYPSDWKGMGTMVEMSTPDFKEWVNSPRARRQIRPERRSDTERRRRVAEMSAEQLRKELLTHELTEIPNRRAYDEAEKLPVQVSVDVDSLKWINDNMGHDSGNELLKAIASSLSQHTEQAFHLSGDEFAVQAHTEAEAQEVMRQVADHLQHATIEVELPDGKIRQIKGLGVSFGTGKTLKEADEALQGHKSRRESEGLRAPRGEAPPGASIRPGESGREDQAHHPSEEEGLTRTQVKEDGAAFSEPKALSTAEGGTADKTGKGPTLDLFAPTNRPNAALARKVAGPTQAARAGQSVQTRLVRTGTFTSGIKRVKTWQDAAHILAPLRKSPQESLMALVLDAARKPIAVLRHSLGTFNEAPAHVGHLAGSILRIPGAKTFYLAHNHPSGNPEASLTDAATTQRINDLTRGSGVELDGHVIFQPGSKEATFLPDEPPIGAPGARGEITAASRHRGTPVEQLERQFSHTVPLEKQAPAITEQPMALQAAKVASHQTKSDSGILLLNNQSRVVRVLPMDAEQMARLRTRDPSTGIGAILRAVEASNGSQAIVFSHVKDQRAADNAAKALNAASVGVIDRVAHGGGVGWHNRGSGLRLGTHFESRRADPRVMDPAQFKQGDEDDGYLYHVTTQKAAKEILKNGFTYSLGQSRFGGAYGAGSKGAVFVGERRGVSYWRNRIQEALEQQHDNPPKLTVLRIPKEGVNLEPDPLATTPGEKILGSYRVQDLDSLNQALKKESPDVRDAQILKRQRTTANTGHMTNVANIVARTVRDHGLAGPGLPPIQVHRDISTLPEHIRDRIAADKAEELTSAVYDPQEGHVHVIAANNGSEREVQENILHEVVGHHGLRMAMDPAEYNETMDGINRDMPERVEAAAQRNGLDLDDPRQRRAAAEEVVAYTAGQMLSGQEIPKPMVPWYERVLRSVRGFVTKLRGGKVYDDKALHALIARAKDSVRTGSVGLLPGEPMSAARAPRYYSALERFVSGSKQEKAGADQWLGMLKNAPGVKAEELDWLGVPEWLKAQTGPVTRQEFADHLARNAVSLEETTYGEKAPAETQQTQDEREQIRQAEALRAQGHLVTFDDDGHLDQFHYKRPGIQDGEPVYRAHSVNLEHYIYDQFHPEVPEELRQRVKALEELSGRVAQHRATPAGWGETGGGSDTRYDDYTLPGGENYQEMLLRLPDTSDRQEIESDYQSAESARQLRDRNAARDRRTGTYRSSHWREPNVVAHVRFKDRTDAQGRKVLHLEELQSDWHQGGRDRGYLPPNVEELKAAAKARVKELLPEARERLRRNQNLGFDHSLDALQALVDHADFNQRWDIDPADQEYLSKTVDAVREANRLENAGLPGGPVPDAPFKQSWPMLIMKRMIRYAAENGHDRLSWTTGEQNADRYGLQKHIDALHYWRQADGTWRLETERNGANQDVHQSIPDKELPDYVGNELAERMRNGEGAQRIQREGEPRTLEGLDLKVGGEGMREFYDRILPREAQKLVKKYGGKVQSGLVHTDESLGGPWKFRADMPMTVDDIQRRRDAAARSGRSLLVDEMDKVLDAMKAGTPFEEAALAHASNASARFYGGEFYQDKVPNAESAHGFDITPELRNAALSEGFPLFARRQSALALQQPKPKGVFQRMKAAWDLAYESKFSRDIRKYAHPVGLSQESRQAARTAIAYLGRQAHDSVESQEALEKFSRVIEQLPVADQLEMIDHIERGLPQPNPELQPVADKMREMLDYWRDQVRNLGDGYLDNFIQDYFPHYWADADQEKAQRLVADIQGRAPLRGPATFLKQRTIPTIKEGMDKGLKPLSTNPLILTLLKTREMQRFVTGVKLMKQYKEDGLAVFLPATHPMPDGWAGINDNIAKVRQWSDAEQGFIDRGQYIMPIDAARVINNHVSRSWFRDFSPIDMVRVTGNMLNAMQLGFSAFHLGFTTLDAIISKNALAIERLLHGEPARAAASFLEALTGPGAALLNVRRGHNLLKAYTNVGGATPEMAKLVQALQEGGGRAHMDKYYQLAQGVSPFRGVGFRSLAGDLWDAMHAPTDKLENLARAAGNFPKEYATKLLREAQALGKTHTVLQMPFEIAGRMVRASTSWIMEHLVPMQKLGVFSDLAADHLRRNPNQDPHERAAAMQSIWASVDNRLGEMVYDNLFWNRTMKDALHLGIRAVGWNVGTVSEIAGAPADLVSAIAHAVEQRRYSADDLGHKIPYVLAMAATTAIYGAVMNYFFTGEGPKETKDVYFPRTGGTTNYGTPQRVSLPSYAKDVYEYSQQPGETVLNKLNPMFNVIGEMWRNEDFFGNPITDPGESGWEAAKHRAQFVASEFTPFSLQGRQQIAQSDQPGLGGQVRRLLPSVGITPAPGYVTSPEQIETLKKFEAEKKYVSDMSFKYKKALLNKDEAGAKEYLERLIAAKKHLGELTRDRMQDKGKAAVARRKNATALRQQGMPAMANLVAALPLQPDGEAIHFFERQAAGA